MKKINSIDDFEVYYTLLNISISKLKLKPAKMECNCFSFY